LDIRSQITLRTKKLGVLIRDARLNARRSLEECSAVIGLNWGILRVYEEGLRAPSLPELEILAIYLNLPISHFWGNNSVLREPSISKPFNRPQLAELRQRIIGALLRQERNKARLTIKNIAQKTTIPPGRIKAYELGERPIPLPELEVLLRVLSCRIDMFFDHSGPISEWMTDQKFIQQFLGLPKDLQAFVCQPENRPYLELATKLSSMSTDKLHSVAEGLLEITL